ncbi:DUF1854 domain-containing protein [Kiritimatiellota bacterium B12222]|nr:DUF1854 domain-containing protein [Kiritimatiellota bacterium B12222]
MEAPILIQLPDGRLAMQSPDGPQAIQIAPCFPWKDPLHYLSFRNDKNEELYFLKSLEELSPESQKILQAEMTQHTGIFVIESIQILRKEIELRCWEVTTTQGKRSFQTELDEWPRQLPDGSFLIEDLFGDLYAVNSLKNLDPTSQRLFWPLIG